MAVVVTAVERVIAAHPGATVAVVAHGGVINAYLSHVLGRPDPMFFEPAYTSISRVLAARSGHRQIRTVNEHAHVRTLL
jgi:probable phosphoglycerate mutase